MGGGGGGGVVLARGNILIAQWSRAQNADGWGGSEAGWYGGPISYLGGVVPYRIKKSGSTLETMALFYLIDFGHIRRKPISLETTPS